LFAIFYFVIQIQKKRKRGSMIDIYHFDGVAFI
jgi:hypothetical protein